VSALALDLAQRFVEGDVNEFLALVERLMVAPDLKAVLLVLADDAHCAASYAAALTAITSLVTIEVAAPIEQAAPQPATLERAELCLADIPVALEEIRKGCSSWDESNEWGVMLKLIQDLKVPHEELSSLQIIVQGSRGLTYQGVKWRSIGQTINMGLSISDAVLPLLLGLSLHMTGAGSTLTSLAAGGLALGSSLMTWLSNSLMKTAVQQRLFAAEMMRELLVIFIHTAAEQCCKVKHLRQRFDDMQAENSSK